MSNTLTTLFAIVILLTIGVIAFFVYKQNQKLIKEASDENDAQNETEDNDESNEPETDSNSEDEEEEEVIVPEHCKIKEETIDVPNKYFYNIHQYISAKGKYIYCVVVSAVIKSRNYRIIAPFSFYPYLNSYTDKVKIKIKSMFNEELTGEEFLKIGCGISNNLGIRVKSLDD